MSYMTSTMSNEYAASKSRIMPWIVVFSAALFFFYEFIQMNMFNAVSADLMRDFSINATSLGNLSAFYFYATIVFLPIAGLLLDRFSTRRIILTALIVCTIGIGCFALTHSLTLAYIFRFFSGIGSAFCFLSSIRLAARWFPPQRMALIAGLIVTMAMIGGMVAQTPLTLLTETVGWRNALLCDAALGLIITAIIWFAVRDYPVEMQHEYRSTAATELKNMGVFKSWRMAYLNPQNWGCAIYTCLMNLPLALLGAIWGSLFLQQVGHFSATQASYAPMMLFIGTIIGGPVVGWFSDRIQKRKLPMILGIFLSLLTMLVIMYVPQLSLLSYMSLFLILGFVTSTQVISYPLVTESNPKILTATSVSVVSFLAMSGYAIFQPLFGWLMDSHWQGKIIDNVRIYSADDYHRALFILPIAFIVALLATFLMRETNCKAVQ